MKAALFALLFLASACAQIDYAKDPPEDWPKMRKVRLYDVSFCGAFEAACARADFARTTCYVIAARDAAQWIVEHEQAHCDGRDHTGDEVASNAWERYKQTAGRQ